MAFWLRICWRYDPLAVMQTPCAPDGGGISKAVTDANRLTIVLENRLKSSDYSDHLVEFETSEPNISYCVIPYF